MRPVELKKKGERRKLERNKVRLVSKQMTGKNGEMDIDISAQFKEFNRPQLHELNQNVQIREEIEGAILRK